MRQNLRIQAAFKCIQRAKVSFRRQIIPCIYHAITKEIKSGGCATRWQIKFINMATATTTVIVAHREKKAWILCGVVQI